MTTTYDATEDLSIAFGENSELFYFPGDMHLNLEGLKSYGELIGKNLAERMISSGLVSQGS